MALLVINPINDLLGATEDDLLLVTIMVTGTLCQSKECATALASKGVVEALINLLNGMMLNLDKKNRLSQFLPVVLRYGFSIVMVLCLFVAKQEDDEIVLQVMYVFYQLLFHDTTRDITIQQSRILIISYFIASSCYIKYNNIRTILMQSYYKAFSW